MKTKTPPLFSASRAILLVCCLTATVGATGVFSNEIIKANNTTDLDLPESWVGEVPPSAFDVAVWDATVTTANTSVLNSTQSWDGIRIANPGGLVTISGGSLNLSGASNGLSIDLSAATQDLTLTTTLSLGAAQEWSVGTGRTLTTGAVFGTGLNLTKTGNGTVRFLQNAYFESLTILSGRVAMATGRVIEAPGGIILGGPDGINPTLDFSQGKAPPLYVAPHTGGAMLDTDIPSNSTLRLSEVILESPLTIHRSNSFLAYVTIQAEESILGGTAPGTDALIFSAFNSASPTNWRTRSTAPNDFTGNVQFKNGRWYLGILGEPDNWIIPDASLITIAAPAQVTWSISQLHETIDGLAGTGIMQMSGADNTFVINADNWANEGSRVFAGSLAQLGTTTWIFGGAGTQVLAGNRITYGGPTVIDSGTLVLRDATAFASSSIALNGGTLELQATSDNWSFGRPITSGAGDFVKSGDGTVTLTAAAAHTGKTQINGGTLALGAGGSLPNTSGVVINGGTFNVSALASGYQVSALLGTGSIAGSVTVSSRLAIGNSPGTMNFENLTLATESNAEFEVTGGGTAADLANVSGQLNLNGATLSVLQLGTYTPNQKFTLFAYSVGNLLGTFKDLPDGAQFTAAGGPWQIDYDDPTAGLNGGTGNRFVTLTAVPEPAVAGMLGIVLVTAALRRRRG